MRSIRDRRDLTLTESFIGLGLFYNPVLLGVAMKSETRKNRIPRPKNAAPNTIFTSFEVKTNPSSWDVDKIRYSGEPIPVLNELEREFSVPVAWGLCASPDGPVDGDVPVGSCMMSRQVKDDIPPYVREAENGDTAASKPARTHAFTTWFEYLLEEAAK